MRQWARGILTGQMTPIEGARRIAEGDSAEAAVFAALVAQWSDDEDARQECERQIVDEAGLLVADTA